jgi:hypothetical protein
MRVTSEMSLPTPCQIPLKADELIRSRRRAGYAISRSKNHATLQLSQNEGSSMRLFVGHR